MWVVLRQLVPLLSSLSTRRRRFNIVLLPLSVAKMSIRNSPQIKNFQSISNNHRDVRSELRIPFIALVCRIIISSHIRSIIDGCFAAVISFRYPLPVHWSAALLPPACHILLRENPPLFTVELKPIRGNDFELGCVLCVLECFLKQRLHFTPIPNYQSMTFFRLRLSRVL
ncbi:hypothetical protein TcasGA2_TC000878 [Tribolium castaneum]|uniref:Uncharacterized protein n=1 Tax=Tribolium castaneum TaxID=7070 RepID=D6W8Y1_TRICA|nr:hypothetical protein TcasGA2_TC000878 [Tribolium castaneum]